jgi:hypothetical protein
MERIVVLKTRALFVLLAFACSPPDLGTTQAEGACRGFANALCTRTQTCSAAIFNERWPDFGTCLLYETIQCINSSIAPSSGESAYVQGCTSVLEGDSWDCSDFLSTMSPPAACVSPSGTLANGAPCAKGSQCQGSYCAVAEGATCGTCGPPPPAGTPCGPNSFCGAGSYCNDQSVCVAHALPNAPCTPDQTCESGYTCLKGVCTLGQSDAGAPCGLSGDPGCSQLAGLDCNAQVQACEPMLIVAIGQPCGTAFFGQLYAHCGGGAQCINGVCAPTAGLGQSCDDTNGPYCINLARCVGGRCTITDATSCN